MLVQSNYVDSPIQDCAQVSQVWSMLLFYNHNHRSLTYQTAMPLFCVLCTKGMSQGFGEIQLNFNIKQIFYVTVMFLEYCTCFMEILLSLCVYFVQ